MPAYGDTQDSHGDGPPGTIRDSKYSRTHGNGEECHDSAPRNMDGQKHLHKDQVEANVLSCVCISLHGVVTWTLKNDFFRVLRLRIDAFE